MGCDVHCYVEHKHKDGQHWSSLGERINPGRWYHLFAKLAGVRSYDGTKAIVEPRGIPSDLSFSASNDWFLYINDRLAEQDGWCSLENAQRYEKYGSTIVYHDGKPWKVTHPDWHTPGWITADELEQVLNAVSAHGNPVEYKAVLAAMRSLEASGMDVRLVFWFDN